MNLTPHGLLLPLLATVVALAGALTGLLLTGARERTRIVTPLSGGILLGVALFGLLPELQGQIGWLADLLLFASGYLLVFAVNRYLFSVCPSCAHDHDHDGCRSALHGFTYPLVIATAAHAFLDGWSMVTAQESSAVGARLAVPLAVFLHKVPEGLALGSILESSTGARWSALAWSLAAESATLLGGAAGSFSSGALRSEWTMFPLGVAGGSFLYLGYHAIHGEWKRRGALPAFVPALTGAAGAAALQQGFRAFFG